MRILFPFLLFLFGPVISYTQSIMVSGACITGTSTLNKVADENGKVAFEGTGTVAGNTGVSISIFWLGAPDNLWVLAYDGQPYYSNACNRSTPPSTTNAGCTWTVVEAACSNAAALALGGTGTLPIQLSGFTATKAGSQVQLTWSTSAETNNKGFNVQRSPDGSAWTNIGFVNGAGQSALNRTYHYNDAFPHNGKNYYRLLQVDFDNRSSASMVIMVDVSTKGFYTLHPSGNGRYRLQIESAEPVPLHVVDLNGKKLFTKTAAQGVHEIDLGPYAQGTYLLQLHKGKVVTTEKLFKQ